MKISSNFDGGNIKCLKCSAAANIRLEINKDNQADFYQWFYFRLTGAKGQDCRLKLINAGTASYPAGWEDYQAVASYDRQTWFRVKTEFDGQTLTIQHQPAYNSVYYAYFAPYSMESHADLIAEAQLSPRVQAEVLGSTLDQQDLDLLRIGQPTQHKKTVWIIGRQHPGETMTAWWVEGFIKRLLDEDDPLARELLKQAVFYVIPNMNPDGSRLGNLRTNAAGVDLNRAWSEASMERSPEVFVVRQKIKETGVDFFLDVHGDEAMPYNFIVASTDIAHEHDPRPELLQRYMNVLKQVNPDFQAQHGYATTNACGSKRMSNNYVAETFGCLALILEMPFKDTIKTPHKGEGWSPNRCRKLGEATLTALYAIIANLG